MELSLPARATDHAFDLDMARRLKLLGSIGLIALLLAIGPSIVASSLWAWMAMLAYLGLLFAALRYAPATLLLLAPLLALRVTEFMSGVAIESGAYMAETFRYGSPTGAFARLLLIESVFFLTAALIVEPFWAKNSARFVEAKPFWDQRLANFEKICWLLTIFLVVYSIYLHAQYGLPVLIGEDRFHFRTRVGNAVFDLVVANRSIIAMVAGLLLLSSRRKLSAIVCFVALIVFSIGIGEKFTSLVVLTITYITPRGLSYIAEGRPIPVKNVIYISSLVTLLVIPTVLLAYGAANDLNVAIQRFFDRATVQGQLWFLTDRDHGSFLATQWGPLWADAQTFFRPSQQNATIIRDDFGLYWIMSEYVHSTDLGYIMNTGNGYVFSQQSYILRASGYLGLIVSTVIMAGYHSLALIGLIFAYSRRNLIAIVALGRVLSFLYAFYVSGYLYLAFGIKTIVALLVAIAALWIAKHRFVWR